MALTEAAYAAGRGKGTDLSSRHHLLAARRGRKKAAIALVYCLMNGFTHNGLVRNRFGHPSFPRKRESRDSSSNGPLVHGEAPLGPRLRGDDELSRKLFARHYTRLC